MNKIINEWMDGCVDSLTTVGLVAAVLTVLDAVTLGVLLQDAGAAAAPIPDRRAGGL